MNKKTCDCVKVIETKLKKKYPEYKEIQIDTVLNLVTLQSYPCILITYKEIQKSGRKRNKTMSLKGVYCPFCGKKYDNSN
jgi:hypothetical protein